LYFDSAELMVLPIPPQLTQHVVITVYWHAAADAIASSACMWIS